MAVFNIAGIMLIKCVCNAVMKEWRRIPLLGNISTAFLSISFLKIILL